MSRFDIDPALKQWASTEKQVEHIDAIIAHGGNCERTAKALGLNRSTLTKLVRTLKIRAASHGDAPEHDMVHTVPEGFIVKGVSTLYDGNGDVRQQWVKSKTDDVVRELAIRETFAAMAEDLPRVEPQPAPQSLHMADKLCNVFTITDYHMGMLAWHREGGDDWDLKIAEETLYRGFEAMLELAPYAHTAVINQLGDFLHFDGYVAATPLHGNPLDADGRFPKIVAAVVRVMRRVIDRALQTHQQVHLICAEGNHDLVSSIWLRIMFQQLYENEPRLEVNENMLPYYKFSWGKTLLGFHHGHLSKNAQLPGLFAAQFRQAWGEAEFCYIHTGHRHHKDIKDFPGATVVQHSTLAARDAYAARGGWFSDRQAMAITYHKDFGELSSVVITPKMLLEMAVDV